ncbi:polycomb protein Asx-like isoform X2 [Dinothrombium tinctorium]|uniref:Polycomb protein Asx-like isoform X2 n=1 Tax=Dinothrombium tinctorium TaxID=1965070 RepID=A0A3S3RUT9_9ACAR|nr:polycomb protein Asx-like isoform X2 [Dinothrombium tinctorium]
MEDVNIRNDYISAIDAHVNKLLDTVKNKEKKRKGKTSQAAQIADSKEKRIDLSTPDSILVHTNLKAIINKQTFASLPHFYQYKLVQMVPKCDQLRTPDGWVRLSPTALNNEFFTKASKAWIERLREGKLTPEFLQRRKNEIEKERLKVDPWKIKNFEPIWGETLESRRYAESEYDRIPKTCINFNNCSSNETGSRSSSSCSSRLEDESLSSVQEIISNRESNDMPLKSILKGPKLVEDLIEKNIEFESSTEENVITDESTIPYSDDNDNLVLSDAQPKKVRIQEVFEDIVEEQVETTEVSTSSSTTTATTLVKTDEQNLVSKVNTVVIPGTKTTASISTEISTTSVHSKRRLPRKRNTPLVMNSDGVDEKRSFLICQKAVAQSANNKLFYVSNHGKIHQFNASDNSPLIAERETSSKSQSNNFNSVSPSVPSESVTNIVGYSNTSEVKSGFNDPNLSDSEFNSAIENEVETLDNDHVEISKNQYEIRTCNLKKNVSADTDNLSMLSEAALATSTTLNATEGYSVEFQRITPEDEEMAKVEEEATSPQNKMSPLITTIQTPKSVEAKPAENLPKITIQPIVQQPILQAHTMNVKESKGDNSSVSVVKLGRARTSSRVTSVTPPTPIVQKVVSPVVMTTSPSVIVSSGSAGRISTSPLTSSPQSLTQMSTMQNVIHLQNPQVSNPFLSSTRSSPPQQQKVNIHQLHTDTVFVPVTHESNADSSNTAIYSQDGRTPQILSQNQTIIQSQPHYHQQNTPQNFVFQPQTERNASVTQPQPQSQTVIRLPPLPYKLPDGITIIPFTVNSSNEVPVITTAQSAPQPPASTQSQQLWILPTGTDTVPELRCNAVSNHVNATSLSVAVHTQNQQNQQICDYNNQLTSTPSPTVQLPLNYCGEIARLPSQITVIPLGPAPSTGGNQPGNAGGTGSNSSDCACNLKAMVECIKCGAFCHDDCIGPSRLCVTCLVR